MSLNLKPLDGASRMLIDVQLAVAPGTGGRFQPTGFPDLGPALYKGFQNEKCKEGTKTIPIDMLLVESVQSVANRLEEVCLQGERYNEDCQGIPYVRVVDGNRNNVFLTSSVREPHRLASPYVLGAKLNGQEFRKHLASKLQANKQRPVHIWKMVPEIFGFDPGCVLHGIFLEEIDGRIRLPRLVSGCIEACAPNQANSGGVYRGEVTAKDNIPYPRQEFTSSNISASFIIHLATLNAYCLDDDKRRFLQLWALYKIDRLLNGYLRLRTACEFDVEKITVFLDGKPYDIALSKKDDTCAWPNSEIILSAFLGAKEKCFPINKEIQDELLQQHISTVVFSVDIFVQEDVPEGVKTEDFKLSGFEDRVSIKEIVKGKGKNKKASTALTLSGEWSEDDQRALLSQNPELKETESGDEIKNDAFQILNSAIKKWNEAFKKQLKKTDENEGNEE